MIGVQAAPVPPPASGAFIEAAGQVVIEAENNAQTIPLGGRGWTLVGAPAGFAGTGLMEIGPNNGGFASSAAAPGSDPPRYPIQFATAGTYHVWIRGIGASGNDD